MKGHKTKLEIKDSYLIIALSVSIFSELDVPTLVSSSSHELSLCLRQDYLQTGLLLAD